MLFYIRCPSCARVLSMRLDEYQEEKDQIMNNPKLNKKQKEIKAAALLTKYGITNICCRIRIIGLIPYHEIVVT